MEPAAQYCLMGYRRGLPNQGYPTKREIFNTQNTKKQTSHYKNNSCLRKFCNGYNHFKSVITLNRIAHNVRQNRQTTHRIGCQPTAHHGTFYAAHIQPRINPVTRQKQVGHSRPARF